MINYIEGDLFAAIKEKESVVFITHVVNSENKWGAGFVIPLGNHYPESKKQYHEWGDNQWSCPDNFLHELTDNFVLGQTQFVEVEEGKVIVANMLAQTLGGVRPLRYDALARCMWIVTQIIAAYKAKNPDKKVEIVAPMFGSALAGGDFNFIEQLIEDSWVKNGIDVTIHYLPGQLPSNWTLPTKTE